ncbi:MAG: TonB-dependent receptor [Pseudomonadales bacterium]|nr:TonB-dependent receptor [Pseudomonadales bacterium]
MKPTFIKKAIAVSVGTLALASFASADSIAIEEVVVTAQKRAESLQNVPIAITAFSGDKLREDDITNMQDIGNRTPGLVFAAFSAGQPEIAIRGIGTKEDGAAASDSTVVSVDDVYIAARTAQVFDIFDLERVEVLRGPQGTLYGKNSIGGSINFITSKPSEDLTIRARATTGNYGRQDFGGMISGPLTEGLYGKVSFSKRDTDGYLRNLLNGERQGETDTLAWRAQLRWLPSDNVEVMFSADGADDDNGQTNREPVGGKGGLHGCPNCVSNPLAVNQALGGAGDPWTTLAETEGYTDRQVEGYSVKVNWELENFTFTSITAYRESDFDWVEDSEGLPPAPFIDLTAGGGALLGSLPANLGFSFDLNDVALEETEQYTQEFRLTSNATDGLKWVVGFFYSEEEIERHESFTFTSLGGFGQLSEQTSNQLNESTSWAVYGQATYDLTDTLSLTGGLRYSTEEKEIGVGADVTSGIGLLLLDFPYTNAEEDWDSIDGRLALNWQAAEDIMLYASITTGFKSGGFTGSATTLAVATTPFDDESALSYEVGFKSLLLDKSLQLNVTAFFTDYEDLQVTRFFTPAGNNQLGQFFTENAGEAEISGLEVEVLWLPMEGLEIGGSYAYLDTEYTDFTGTIDSGGNDFSGNDLRQSPPNTVNVFAKYTMNLSDDIGSISAKVDYRYQDLSFYDPDESLTTSIPQYRIWNGRIAWRSPQGHWEVAGWIKNIGDEEYRTHLYSQRSGDVAFALFGEPRTSGVTVSYNY